MQSVPQSVAATCLIGLGPEKRGEGVARVKSARAGKHQVRQHCESPWLGEKWSRRVAIGANDAHWAEDL